jgi:hypothetical protein
MMGRVFHTVHGLLGLIVMIIMIGVQAPPSAHAAEGDALRTISGVVQHQDLRRVGQAFVEIKDQEGNLVTRGVTNDMGVFTVMAPEEGTYSVHAILETYRSEYLVLNVGTEPVNPITLTLSHTQEIALEIVAPRLPLQYRASSETYSLSQKDIEQLPMGNNQDVFQLITGNLPSAAEDGLKQIHIHQEHANIQFRIDGVPIPDTISSTFTDVISPRSWERADILMGDSPRSMGSGMRRSLTLRPRVAPRHRVGPSRCSEGPMKP